MQSHHLEVLRRDLVKNALGVFGPQSLLWVTSGHLLKDLWILNFVVYAESALLVLVVDRPTFWASFKRLSQLEHIVEARLRVADSCFLLELAQQVWLLGTHRLIFVKACG